MSRVLIELDPQPPLAARPTGLANPFEPGAPHPLAQVAVEALQAELRNRSWPELGQTGAGKMFGVLLVETPAGRVGYLQGFSGMLDGRWQIDGFVPPLFDLAALAEFWPGGMAELAALEAELRVVHEAADVARRALSDASERQQRERAELRLVHDQHRRARHAARASGADAAPLDQQSRTHGAERRRLDAAQREQLAALEAILAPLDERARELASRRAARSNQLLAQLHDAYTIESFRGERRTLRSLFAPGLPPGGAGDCAAPKLLGEAFRRGLRPLALAEFWWGHPSGRDTRRPGVSYPACRGKCGPILPFMLDGLDVAPATLFGASSATLADPRVVFEDAWLVVVDKPSGLLSVPGRHERLRDSVEVRLAARFEPFIVHRLDLDTSGLLLVAKDRQTHAALQKQFAVRTITKRYLAWLDGSPRADAGVIDLALRVDHDDRPRQIHDPVHGKPALTHWRVLERQGLRSLVELIPHTGRTHQLRVHAAHPLGIGVPIVGDRLYGTPGERLLLHAEALAFDHPQTGARVELRSPAPFDPR